MVVSDPEEVRKYVDDDWCGFVISTGSLKNLYAGVAATMDPDALAKVPNDLPIYVFSGTEDPVHSEKGDIERLVQAFQEAGQNKLTLKWYEGGRHEMLNETNRDEVVADLVAWLDSVVG